MRKTVLAASMGALLNAACASAPVPVIPDGKERMPVNTPAEIQRYNAIVAEEAANRIERTALTRQIEDLTKQVNDLKAFLVMQQMEARTAQSQPVIKQRTPPPTVTPTPLSAEPPAATPALPAIAPEKRSLAPGEGGITKVVMTQPSIEKRSAGTIYPLLNGETVEVREQTVIFRVTHAVAKTEFKPSAQLRELLLKAATNGRHIEIRGRTDGEVATGSEERVALQRAIRARDYLVTSGVDAAKIRFSYLPIGGHLADNRTTRGRAQNRRVEIEMMDLDTALYSPAKLAAQGSMQ